MTLQQLNSGTTLSSPGKVTTTVENDPLLTINQLAEMLGCSVQKIYQWRARGDGPKALRLSHKIMRFRLSDVQAWLKERESTCTAEDL